MFVVFNSMIKLPLNTKIYVNTLFSHQQKVKDEQNTNHYHKKEKEGGSSGPQEFIFWIL